MRCANTRINRFRGVISSPFFMLETVVGITINLYGNSHAGTCCLAPKVEHRKIFYYLQIPPIKYLKGQNCYEKMAFISSNIFLIFASYASFNSPFSVAIPVFAWICRSFLSLISSVGNTKNL